MAGNPERTIGSHGPKAQNDVKRKAQASCFPHEEAPPQRSQNTDRHQRGGSVERFCGRINRNLQRVVKQKSTQQESEAEHKEPFHLRLTKEPGEGNDRAAENGQRGQQRKNIAGGHQSVIPWRSQAQFRRSPRTNHRPTEWSRCRRQSWQTR
jgi:hypothetical protein